MRTVVHLSDIHFGAIDFDAVRPLIDFVREVSPDLVAVSGDLTQRARPREFLQARAFLDSLPGPRIVVPGNHDIPLFNVYARFADPLARFRRYIDPNPEPEWSDEEIAVLGVNTARSFTVKGGRINGDQMERIRARFCGRGPEIKVVVTHHPFDLPPAHGDRLLVGRARAAMERLAGCGVDVFLSGHLHLSHLTLSTARYRIPGLSALIVQGGTATSSRGRGQANSFHVLRFEEPAAAVERILWIPESGRFARADERRFRHEASGWTEV